MLNFDDCLIVHRRWM